MEEDNYAIEFNKTCDDINKLAKKKYMPASTVVGGCLAWAAENAPELSKQEEKLLDRVNVLWMNQIDFDEFKKKVLDWGRAVLNIYKRHHEVIAEKKG